MSTFSVQQIRQKYRKILEQNESEDLQNIGTKTLIAVKKNNGAKRFLTEYNQNMSSSKAQHHSNNILLALKERVAQGIQNMSQKQNEIQSCKERIIKQDTYISVLQNQLNQFKSNLQESSMKIAEEKVSSATLQKQMFRLQKQIQSQFVQKDMIYKQVEFYKEEIRNLKAQKQALKNRLESQKNEIQKMDRMQSQNSRLRDNIKRLQEIIDQCFQGKKQMNFQNKFYLGNSSKVSNSWISQNLVGQVEHFLTKWQIGHLNREFIDSLVKFINGRQRKTNKQKNKECSKKKNSHSRTFSKDYYLSDNDFLRISLTQNKKSDLSIKKSLKLKDIKIDKKMQKRLSSLYQDQKKINIINAYESIFSEYQNALNLALNVPKIEPKKIVSLSHELKSLLNDYFKTNFDKDI